MSRLNQLLDALGDVASDIKANAHAVLTADKLTQTQVWATAVVSVMFLDDHGLSQAVLAEARDAGLTAEMEEDARAAAAIMAMNTTYYRFGHLLDSEDYAKVPARLQSKRAHELASGDKTVFDLMCMACAVLAGCGACIQAHDRSLRTKRQMTAEQVNDAARIASVIQALVIARRL